MITTAPEVSPQTGTLSTSASVNRVLSIDILRAMTMVLMIFVNDLWSLKDIPAWLGHVERGVDGMGLADVVFPAFLFIVGLSIPFAMEARIKKGDDTGQLIKHVFVRSLALVVMGVFLVNGETINVEAMGFPKGLWYPLCCLSFILIWNTYPRTMNKNLVYGLKGIAIITLTILAFLYRGGSNENIEYFAPHWWGILGLIGWSYFAAGVIAIFAKDNLYVIAGAWMLFSLISVLSHAKMIPSALGFIPEPIVGGTLTGLVLGGVLTSMIFRLMKHEPGKLTLTLGAFTALLYVLYAVTRPQWGLAKLGATPAWLFLCSALTIIAFLVIFWIADVKGKGAWFAFLKPAGTATLLCYLIPYFAYATTRFLGIHLPEEVLIGGIGLLKSLLFALLCVYITGLLLKLGVSVRL